jgi:membrane-anchored mycosin MYCP
VRPRAGTVRTGTVRTGTVRTGTVRAGTVRAGTVRTGTVRTGVVGVAVAGLVVAAAGPAVAAPEQQPRENACRYHDPKVTNTRLPQALAAEQTWPQARLAYADALRWGRGEGVTVAVVDSGVDGGQEQLAGRVLNGFDVTSGGEPAPGARFDCAGHGTAVAGIIAGQPRTGRAFAGVAPGVRLLPIRQSWGIDDRGQPIAGSAANLVRAIRLALDQGAQVVNVSVTVAASALGAAERNQFAQVARLAEERSAVIVAASGNKDEYQNQNIATYPAALAATSPAVIAVGGIGKDGALDQNSITGPFVTVVAPDRDMPCLLAGARQGGGGLVPCTGTSFAAPFVSGVAALLIGRQPTLTSAEIKRRIEQTADHPSTDLPNPEQGWGVVNPVAAMTAVLPRPRQDAIQTAAPLPQPSAADAHTRVVGIAVASAAALVALIVIIVAAILPRGRRRNWRPGSVAD